MYDNLIKTFTQFNIIVERGGGLQSRSIKKTTKIINLSLSVSCNNIFTKDKRIYSILSTYPLHTFSFASFHFPIHNQGDKNIIVSALHFIKTREYTTHL